MPDTIIVYTDGERPRPMNQTVRTRAKDAKHYGEGDNTAWRIARVEFSLQSTSNILEIRPEDPEVTVDVVGLPWEVSEVTFTETEIRGGTPVVIFGRRLTFPTGTARTYDFLVATPPDTIVTAFDQGIGENPRTFTLDDRRLIRTKVFIKAP